MCQGTHILAWAHDRVHVQLEGQLVESVLSYHVGPKGTEVNSSALVARVLTPEPSYQLLHFLNTKVRIDVVTAKVNHRN